MVHQQDGNPEVVGEDSAHMNRAPSGAGSSPRSTRSTTTVKSGAFHITYAKVFYLINHIICIF